MGSIGSTAFEIVCSTSRTACAVKNVSTRCATFDDDDKWLDRDTDNGRYHFVCLQIEVRIQDAWKR